MENMSSSMKFLLLYDDQTWWIVLYDTLDIGNYISRNHFKSINMIPVSADKNI
jgi:hypothetical protein